MGERGKVVKWSCLCSCGFTLEWRLGSKTLLVSKRDYASKHHRKNTSHTLDINITYRKEPK